MMSKLVCAALHIVLAMNITIAAAAEPVTVTNAWVRATVPGQVVAGGYLDITAAAPAALVAVQTSVAAKSELHTMSMDGGVMKMRPLDQIELPARQTVSLKPGGDHIMLNGIKRELKAGERVKLRLTLQDRRGVKSTLDVDAEVRAGADAARHAK